MRSNFSFAIAGVDSPAAPYSGSITLGRSLLVQLTEGSGDDQFSAGLIFEQVINPSSAVEIDLQMALDAFGVPLAAIDILGLLVESYDGGGTLQLEPGTENGLTSLLRPGTVLRLPTPSFVLFSNRKAGRLIVNSSNKTILLRNSHGGLSVSARVIALVRR